MAGIQSREIEPIAGQHPSRQATAVCRYHKEWSDNRMRRTWDRIWRVFAALLHVTKLATPVTSLGRECALSRTYISALLYTKKTTVCFFVALQLLIRCFTHDTSNLARFQRDSSRFHSSRRGNFTRCVPYLGILCTVRLTRHSITYEAAVTEHVGRYEDVNQKTKSEMAHGVQHGMHSREQCIAHHKCGFT